MVMDHAFHSTNQIKEVRSEKKMNHIIPQTKHTLNNQVMRFNFGKSYLGTPFLHGICHDPVVYR